MVQFFKYEGLYYFRFVYGENAVITSDQGFKRKSNCERSWRSLRDLILKDNCKYSIVPISLSYRAEFKNENGQVLAVSDSKATSDKAMKAAINILEVIKNSYSPEGFSVQIENEEWPHDADSKCMMIVGVCFLIGVIAMIYNLFQAFYF